MPVAELEEHPNTARGYSCIHILKGTSCGLLTIEVAYAIFNELYYQI